MTLELEFRAVTGAIIDSAMRVHSALGPGLLERAYEDFLEHELRERGLKVERQFSLPVRYKGIQLDLGYRVDLLVENAVVVEVKTVDRIHPVHEAQILSYLKLNEFRVGLLINFRSAKLRTGIKRFVNRL